MNTLSIIAWMLVWGYPTNTPGTLGPIWHFDAEPASAWSHTRAECEAKGNQFAPSRAKQHDNGSWWCVNVALSVPSLPEPK
jgi:hypothetical protein